MKRNKIDNSSIAGKLFIHHGMCNVCTVYLGMVRSFSLQTTEYIYTYMYLVRS